MSIGRDMLHTAIATLDLHDGWLSRLLARMAAANWDIVRVLTQTTTCEPNHNDEMNHAKRLPLYLAAMAGPTLGDCGMKGLLGCDHANGL